MTTVKFVLELEFEGMEVSAEQARLLAVVLERAAQDGWNIDLPKRMAKESMFGEKDAASIDELWKEGAGIFVRQG